MNSVLPTSKRRPQFNLLVMLGAVSCLAAIFALLKAPNDQRRLALRIQEIGGSVTWGGTLNSKGKVGRPYIGAVDLTGTKVTDDDLREIVRLSELTDLRANDTQITAAGLAHLANLPRIKQLELTLYIDGNDVSDTEVASLRNAFPNQLARGDSF